MGDIDESKVQSAIDELRASARKFFEAAQSVQKRAQHLFGISLDITYSASDWAGAGSQAFQNAWGQFDLDSRKAIDALKSTGDALNNLAKKLENALEAKQRAEQTQDALIWATLGLIIVDAAQLGLDPATDAATVAVGAEALAAEGAVDLGALVADADIVAEGELAGIETTEVGSLDTLDEGALDSQSSASITEGEDFPGVSSRTPESFDEPGLSEGGGNYGLNNTENFRSDATKHIFEGDLNPSGTASKGYHYEGMPNTPGSTEPGTESPPNAYGAYTAKVTVNGVPKAANGGFSTFFPKLMSPQEVVDSINEAYTSRSFLYGNTWSGVTSSGMTIEMYLDAAGKIISAFPVY